jgi:uncharacterized membrane protein YqjE
MNDPIKAAQQLGSSEANVQVWFLIILGIAAVVWAVKAFREESAGLRADLKEQSRAREESLVQLIKCVDHNTAALQDNKAVLESTRYQLKRSQETLEKFTV